MTPDPWYARMAQEHRERHAPKVLIPPPSGPTPDDCDECYEWKPDWKGDEEPDWLWFKQCAWDCPHEHHDKDFWLA